MEFTFRTIFTGILLGLILGFVGCFVAGPLAFVFTIPVGVVVWWPIAIYMKATGEDDEIKTDVANRRREKQEDKEAERQRRRDKYKTGLW